LNISASIIWNSSNSLHYAQGKCFGKRMAEVLEDRREYLVSCGLLSFFKKTKSQQNQRNAKRLLNRRT